MEMNFFTVDIHHRGFRGVTVPRLLRFICLKILAKVLLIQGDPEESTATVEQKESQLDAFRELRLQLNVRLISYLSPFIDLISKQNILCFSSQRRKNLIVS